MTQYRNLHTNEKTGDNDYHDLENKFKNFKKRI